MNKKSQLVFGFPQSADYTAANFMEFSCNTDALNALRRFPSKESDIMVIYGNSGVGKSHLLHIWSAQVGDRYIPVEKLNEVPFNVRKVAIDGLEKAGKREQENLFFLFNHIIESGGAMLVASNKPVASMDLIPELKSRLLLGTQIEITNPNEQQLEMLLVKWASDRQIALEPAVISYLIKHSERSVCVLEQVIAGLDKLSLVQKRKITVPLVKELLKEQ